MCILCIFLDLKVNIEQILYSLCNLTVHAIISQNLASQQCYLRLLGGRHLFLMVKFFPFNPWIQWLFTRSFP